jgi:hypothetical protein
MTRARLTRRIRFWLGLFIIGLVASGLTAFPLEVETRWLKRIVSSPAWPVSLQAPGLVDWVSRVHDAIADANARYPFLAYGTDWLAFAHLVIALAFLGPWRDPVRNIWVVEWAMLACVAVVPLALVCGAVRGIPMYWRLIDISFGVFGLLPLYVVRRDIRQLESL